MDKTKNGEIKIISYGAAKEVTGSKHLLSANGLNILIDCGMFQGRRKEVERKNKNLPFNPLTIDFAICTHGHYDHCGNYPTLKKNGFENPIYSTNATAEIAEIVLKDSAHIQRSDIEFLRKRALKEGKEFEEILPIYTEEDIVEVMKLWHGIDYNEFIELKNGIRFKLIDAGHILGSSQVVFEIEAKNNKTIRILFTGDLGRKGVPILKDPQVDSDFDYIICESTYGDRLHSKFENLEDELATFINKVYQRGGKIIIPSFAIGRTQELVYLIHLLEDKNKIPKDMEIFVDSPMSFNITKIFEKYKDYYDEETKDAFTKHSKNPFGFNKLKYIQTVEESKKLNDMTRCIIISSSGMAEAGRVLHHLANSIENPKNAVCIVGFMAENTLGRRILEKEKEVKIFGTYYQNNAELAVFDSFSAHADYSEVSDYLSNYDKNRLKNIFLIHGESKALEQMKLNLNKVGFKNSTIVEPEVEYLLE